MLTRRLLLFIWLVAAYEQHVALNTQHPARYSPGWWLNDVMRYGDVPPWMREMIRAWSLGVISSQLRSH